MSSINTLYYSANWGIWFLISAAVAILGAIFIGGSLLQTRRMPSFTGWKQKLYDHVNFKRMLVPELLKYAYIASALFAVLSGIVTLIAGSTLTGILLIVLGPVVVRISYELTMVLFSILDGIRETNRLLRAGAASRVNSPKPHAHPIHPIRDDREPQDGAPKHYPGGYDPIHKA